MPTMHELYNDGSPHQACPKCGMCKTCGDCMCTAFREFVCANLLDGVEAGVVSMPATKLLDAMQELYDAFHDDPNNDSSS